MAHALPPRRWRLSASASDVSRRSRSARSPRPRARRRRRPARRRPRPTRARARRSRSRRRRATRRRSRTASAGRRTSTSPSSSTASRSRCSASASSRRRSRRPTSRAIDLHQLRYYRIADYLKALGVDVSRVQRVDFDGNRDRIASIEGTELRNGKDRFVFDFLGRTGGAPKQAWDTMGLKNGMRIDEIFGVNVFVKTTPWTIDHALHCYRKTGRATRTIARRSASGPTKTS